MPSERKSTPLKAIRLKCLDCCLDQPHEVRLCGAKDCPIYRYRFGRKPMAKTTKGTPTPLRAIRLRCLDCSAFSTERVRECESKHCALYVYRMGKNPNRTGIGGNPRLSTQNEWPQGADVPRREDASEKAA